MGATQDFAIGLGKIVTIRVIAYITERPAPDWLTVIIAGIAFGASLASLYSDWNNKYALLGGATASFLVMIGTATRRLASIVQSMTAFVLRNPSLKALITAITQFANSVLGLIQNFIRKLIDVVEAILGATLTVIATARALQL
jgi:hypothetical protein